MATNVDTSRSIAELDVPRSSGKGASVNWEMAVLVGAIVLVSMALLYLPYIFSSY